MSKANAPQRSELTLRCASCGACARPIVKAAGQAGVDLRCRFCGASAQMSVDPERPVVRTADGCPKCSAPRGETSCARCGLIYARWKGPGIARTALPNAETRGQWAKLRESFTKPAMHERFLAHCLHVGALAYAASCYAEEESSADLERAAIAETRRRQVRALAEATYLNGTGRGEDAAKAAKIVRRATLFAGAVALVSLVLWMGTVMTRPRVQRLHQRPAVSMMHDGVPRKW